MAVWIVSFKKVTCAAPAEIRKRRLTCASQKSPTSKNFRLKTAHLQLLESLDEIGSGTVERVIFRDGLPCELEDSID